MRCLQHSSVLTRNASTPPHCKASAGRSEVSQKGALCAAGTISYVAPEVLQKGAIGKPADVYSFSMLLLEMWAGELVYKGVHTHQACGCHIMLQSQSPNTRAAPLHAVEHTSSHAVQV